ncbi:acyl-CoA dehydrogenase [Lampropedia cohaerens]|uniref:Acyl-CoA dehydrogenase n=1 Tax=Lampropedia cohaerens TaxID=1610491 RepID=A0A0U1Q0Z0_9BURK|nr:acyl-CoA dehydrogenase family protein [Lampropedia cohaerens]KKW68420.1 acyl-CoA dehydrogenase [Lampropedia cohaerens]
MNLNFTEDQQQLREAVRKWAERAYPFTQRRRIVEGGGFDRGIWQALAELGLTGLTVDVAHGGMGMGAMEAMVALEELGAALVLEPLEQALIAAEVLAAGEAQIAAHWLPRLAAGQAMLAFAWQEPTMRYRSEGFGVHARREGGQYRLSGTKTLVPAGDHADAWLVAAMRDGGSAIFLVERGAPGVQMQGYLTQDGSRAAELHFADAPAQCVIAEADAVVSQILLLGAASACALGVGVMARTLALTADYLNQRRQFGVPLASFQALRHRIADMQMQLELGRSMSYYAWLKLDAPERRIAVSRAKYQLCESMRYVGQQAVQLHGGIGMTDAYIGSHYFKRLTQLGLLWGDAHYHLDVVSAWMNEHASAID